MDYNSADLTSVLRTLSALSNQQSPPSSSDIIPPTNSQAYNPNGPEDNDPYEPSETLPSFSVTRQQQAQQQKALPSQTPSYTHPPRAQTTPNGTTGDSSSITTWNAALRHVMRTVAQNENLQSRIRWLIRRQHDHEKQWWQGREALVKRQQARTEKKKELDAVLRSVGVPVDNNKSISTAEEDQAELTNYDVKVYRASSQMADAMIAELRALGIPFFSIQKDLVLAADAKSETVVNPFGSQKETLITRQDLLQLQRRILELLLDLCGEQ
ncbi:hypothetical protein BO86DRAFT_393844 [Aspergillus japonicus CBS 114.51]|uniref:Uncharacterized protein n=2 Tax=Aspergillus TaxID=5052 RepID=A0A2V5HH67_ASPV1|nr:hypothetical protein BO86DRAFT_393844 [Aspergillus japonicus CBS 114.51]PYI20653.1 hypothetical protein BO99DRAFT_401789 [Aspergillus violaceofuscus CBS 115571]RAH75961.1 hypothetical protein BO86DRAFT_393844 [Aspergillus japonicus CBS 114.51]